MHQEKISNLFSSNTFYENCCLGGGKSLVEKSSGQLQLEAHWPYPAVWHRPKYLFIWNKLTSRTILHVQHMLLFWPGTSMPSLDGQVRNYQLLWQHQIWERAYLLKEVFPCDCMASKGPVSRRLIHPSLSACRERAVVVLNWFEMGDVTRTEVSKCTWATRLFSLLKQKWEELTRLKEKGIAKR